jgi:hypothetical protein
MRNFISVCRHLLVLGALLVFSMQCLAQSNIRTVYLVKVKMGHDDSWKAAVKDYVSVVKKAGSDQQFTVWDSQSGPLRHAVVWYSAKWKDLGEQDPKLQGVRQEIATIFKRIDADTQSLEIWRDEMQPDLAISSKEIPAFVRTGRARVVRGKMEELEALLRSQLMPALKKGGVTDFGMAEARYGTPVNELHSYLGLHGWADLDAPFGARKGMTDAEYKAFVAKVAPLIESLQWDMWKYEPNLSYLVPAPAK